MALALINNMMQKWHRS